VQGALVQSIQWPCLEVVCKLSAHKSHVRVWWGPPKGQGNACVPDRVQSPWI
jgi:hypothetical protein